MDITVQLSGEQAVIRIRGRFEFSGYRDFRDALDRAFEPPARDLIVDLSGADYIDSSALGMLLIASDRAKAVNRKIALRGSHGAVHEVLQVANLHKRFAIT